ncbi:MAG: trypsin-like peptidase domain-containing protein [Rhodothermales bacterium]
MRHIALFLVLLPVLAGQGRAQVVQDVQLRAEADRSVLFPGDTLRVELSAYVSASHARDALSTGWLLSDVSSPAPDGPLRQVNATRPQSRDGQAIAGTMVYRFTRTFIYVAEDPRPDIVTVGPWILPNAGRPVEAPGIPVEVVPRPAFTPDLARAVLPLFAEIQSAAGTTLLRRDGHAVLVAGSAVLTSWHIIRNASVITVLLPSGRQMRVGRGWAISAERDLALLYVDPSVILDEGIAPVRLAPLPADASEQWLYTLSPGRQSTGRLHAGMDGRRWITTNPVRPGDSGSPLLDSRGDVVGIVTAGTVLSPRTDVLREEITVAHDPRPLLQPFLDGQPPRTIADLIPVNDPWHQMTELGAAMAALSRPDGRRDMNGLSVAATRSLILSELLDLMDAAISAPIPDPELLYSLGLLAHLGGDRQLAEQGFQASIQAEPGHYGANYLLGLINLARRDWTESDLHFGRAAAAGPFRHLATYGRARSAMGMHAWSRAAALLQDVIAYDPSFAPALFDLGQVHVAQGQLNEARQVAGALARVDGYWARRLARMIARPEWGPSSLTEMPLVPFRIPDLL